MADPQRRRHLTDTQPRRGTGHPGTARRQLPAAPRRRHKIHGAHKINDSGPPPRPLAREAGRMLRRGGRPWQPAAHPPVREHHRRGTAGRTLSLAAGGRSRGREHAGKDTATKGQQGLGYIHHNDCYGVCNRDLNGDT